MKTKKTLLILIALTFLLGTRFVNLTWGQPFFFHPDERNIASSISQLSFPRQLNPHFFAYGSLPLYIIYFSGLVINTILSCHTTPIICPVFFEQAIILSRVFSAIFSCLSIILLYKITKKVVSEKQAWLVVFLSIFSTGFIQFSHFGTFEMWTIFFSLLLCYVAIILPYNYQYKHILSFGLITGILIGIKIANLVFFQLIFILLFIPVLKAIIHRYKFRFLLKKFIIQILFFSFIVSIVYALTNPYVFLDNKEFLSSITYETAVATGKLPVFYTQEFLGTVPIIYQLFHVFPFLLNPVLALFSPFIFFGFIFYFWKTKKLSHSIIAIFFIFSFIPQAILFTKWTRYAVTSLPFFMMMIPVFFDQLLEKKKSLQRLCSGLLIGSSVIFSLSYVSLVFFRQDVRDTASQVAESLVPGQAPILSEVYDLGIIPFNKFFPNITLYNFYDLDQDSSTNSNLTVTLKQIAYIILPSQRLLKTRLPNPNRFPKGQSFYQKLITHRQSYQKIYETPCDLLCKIVYLGDPIFRFEGTANVFDRPIVQIYKKL